MGPRIHGRIGTGLSGIPSLQETSMSVLMLVNIDTSTTDEEIQEFIGRYGFPAFDEIERVPGDGTRPAVSLHFNSVDGAALRLLQPRINHLFWKQRKVDAMVLTERFE